jgi:hypothetical protein
MKKFVAVLAALAIANVAVGAMTVTVPDQVIDPLAGEIVQIQVSTDASDVIAGANLNAEIVNPVGGSPVFTGADWVTGTIWAGNNTGGSSTPAGTKISGGVTTQAGSELASGILVNVIVDASSYAPAGGTFQLNNWSNDELFPGFFVDNPTSTVKEGGIQFDMAQDSGTITVTPEPASALLLGLAGLFLRRRR